MNKAYNAINWKNEPSTSTAINETNLNKMDRAIDTIDNRVIDLDNGKVNKEEGKSLVSNTDISKIGANENAIQAHISNKSNPHSVTKAQVGLGNVDNTSDVNKPISTAQQAEFDSLNNNLSQLEFGEESGSGNLCDEEFILGYFNDKGQEISSSNDIRTKNYIKVKPNTTYYLAGNDVVVVKLNESKTPIGYILWRKSNVSFTTDDNTHYIGLARPGVTTYSNDIAIIEGASGSYVPYIPSVKMLAEEVSAQNDSLDTIGKCKNLLNPTLQTTTVNGITCTANGDGTYTLNGTATAKTEFDLMFFYNLEIGKRYKLVGCPSGGSASTYAMYIQKTNTWDNGANDKGNGAIFEAIYNKTYDCWIRIIQGTSINNLVFKPMLTTNLNATYDDFVPYTGDGETLAADVAELKNDLSDCRKKSDITTNETLIGTFNGKNYYRRLFTGIGASGSSITVNVGEKIEIYNYYGRAYTYGQSGASNAKYPIPNKNYYIDSQNASETSFQLTIPTSSDTRKVDLVIEYTKVDE